MKIAFLLLVASILAVHGRWTEQKRWMAVKRAMEIATVLPAVRLEVDAIGTGLYFAPLKKIGITHMRPAIRTLSKGIIEELDDPNCEINVLIGGIHHSIHNQVLPGAGELSMDEAEGLAYYPIGFLNEKEHFMQLAPKLEEGFYDSIFKGPLDKFVDDIRKAGIQLPEDSTVFAAVEENLDEEGLLELSFEEVLIKVVDALEDLEESMTCYQEFDLETPLRAMLEDIASETAHESTQGVLMKLGVAEEEAENAHNFMIEYTKHRLSWLEELVHARFDHDSVHKATIDTLAWALEQEIGFIGAKVLGDKLSTSSDLASAESENQPTQVLAVSRKIISDLDHDRCERAKMRLFLAFAHAAPIREYKLPIALKSSSSAVSSGGVSSGGTSSGDSRYKRDIVDRILARLHEDRSAEVFARDEDPKNLMKTYVDKFGEDGLTERICNVGKGMLTYINGMLKDLPDNERIFLEGILPKFDGLDLEQAIKAGNIAARLPPALFAGSGIKHTHQILDIEDPAPVGIEEILTEMGMLALDDRLYKENFEDKVKVITNAIGSLFTMDQDIACDLTDQQVEDIDDEFAKVIPEIEEYVTYVKKLNAENDLSETDYKVEEIGDDLKTMMGHEKDIPMMIDQETVGQILAALWSKMEIEDMSSESL